MYRAQAMNHALAAVGDPEANLWADRVRQRFRRDSLLCDEYNNRLADGKWRGMMIQKHIGYTSWNDDFPADHLPALKHPRNDRSFSFKSHLFMRIGSKLPSIFCFKSGRNTVSLTLFLMLMLALWSALSL